ncbi:MAG: DUF192 domain-containing protein [Candidatus Doudnabacteria bacterium]|nr:DUF192 domain-containing protein [Candidatus Doudnabacteria bacterium]
MKICNSKKTILCFVAIGLLSVSCNEPDPVGLYNAPIAIGNKKIFVEVANTNEKKTQGLSGRKKLTDNQGMLFDFARINNARPGFWMKEMNFDLDLVWIKDEKIIGITPDVPRPSSPGDKLPLYYPPAPIDAVLEVNAGWSEKNKIEVGDEVRYE